ncbi:sensor histidine kinase [Paenibacillus albiflavus]|uniref:Sensor histidine kinase n=1 Tax=Paenibacillus albiflavus TaxID=2545760 RepID=A0A4R4EER6_9BACL|nr:sensor histidine kinase [Paenibacillus albiflavus]TCZ77733.1 sensor histidine kinase [Paenibacillus albiflavus]
MKTIQRKITLYAGSCFLLLFIALMAAIFIEMEQTVVPLNMSLTQQIVNARSEQISYWFEQRIGEIELLAANGIEHNWSREDMLHEVNRLEAMRPDEYESIRIVDQDGWSWSRGDEAFSIVKREYFLRLLASKDPYVVSNVIQSHASNHAEIVVILYRVSPLVTKDIAYIAAAVPIGKMKEIADDIYVYDGLGKLMVDHEDRGDEQLAQEEGSSEMTTFTSEITRVPGWKLVFEVPQSQLSKGIIRTQRSVAIVGCCLGIFFLILLLLLANSIVKPIRFLQQQMRKVETGDWSIRAHVQQRDEIGDLSKSFNQMMTRLYHYEHEKKEMELRLIQEQIKPHFLYNTLDTIQWQAGAHGADDVVEMVEALSTYFRLGLGSDNQYVTLEQEFHHVESYLHIQCVRYEDILEYELLYEEHLGQEQIIRFLLQPLVENAIYHGIKPLADRKSKISIRAYEADLELHIVVENNGVDIPEDRMDVIRTALSSCKWKDGTIGFGLYSVNHRLKLAYGESYGLHVVSGSGLTRMEIHVPMEVVKADVASHNRR